MCSIMTAGPSTTPEEFREGFEQTKSRGPDDSRIIMTPIGLMGFHRLSIMGLHPEGMQPFERQGYYIVCNGEIYGFQAMKNSLIEKGYAFQSGSDCEILLPLYFEYGLDMFKMLDAEFACVIYDPNEKEYIAARDPLGIRPLYYGHGKNKEILFASEAKNLVPLCKKILSFPPGHYYHKGQFIPFTHITDVKEIVYDDIEVVCANIKDKLIKAVEKRLVADAKVGFLLSGGLDSSLVCAIAAKQSKEPIHTYAIGMDLDAIDLKYARLVADYIHADHHEVIITKEDVIQALQPVIALLGTYDITTIRASIGMHLVCKAIHETSDIRVILTGEVSDELFGYKYTDFAPSPQAFQAEAIKRIDEIHMYDVLRADRCISVNSLEARVPFGDLDFASYVLSIDPAKKVNIYKKGKYLLRHAFEKDDYLPDEILWREKAAFSDAVSHSMVNDLKEYAEDYYTDEEFTSKCKQYDFARPFTKESLLYREIFEKYYPGNAEMVKDFWMPNKE